MSHYDTCTITAIASGKVLDVAVLAFNEGKNLTVVLNKSIKMLMQWNGRFYEARSAGLDFKSDGPKLLPDYNYKRGHK